MQRILYLALLAAWTTAAFAQDHGVPQPHFDAPTTDDPFLIDGESRMYQWPEGRNWLLDAPNDEERWRRLQQYLGGMQGPMFEIGQRFVIFYDALRDGNNALAIDEWMAIARVFVNAVTIRPQYKPAADAMFLRSQWHQMLGALRSNDPDKIWREFAYTKSVCQSCHQATNMEWANNQRVFQDTVYPFDGADAATEVVALSSDLVDAEEIFRPCTGCHTVQAGGPHLVGPNLHGMFDRGFGRSEGFAYSEALGQTNRPITEETLNDWLIDSSQAVPGSQMLYPGLRTQEERDAVINYLGRITQ